MKPHQHHSWLLIIVIPLAILALILSLIFGFFNVFNEVDVAPQSQPLISEPRTEEQPFVATNTPTPTLSQSNQIEAIEKDLEATTIDGLESELDQIEAIFNQF